MVGRYRILAKLGQGGLATVWKAHDELLGRTVALKILNEGLVSSSKARRRFIHDAQAVAILEHPGIIAVYDMGEAEGLAYIALSFIDGETVSEKASRRLMPVEEAVRIVRDAASALGHAHERGVIHRDVTGRNIMVARDGRVFVLDFGLALAAGQSRVTTGETALGTIYYMAPEVIQAQQADVRCDLYGLGVVLYEALTGTFPFLADAAPAVFYRATNESPVPPRVHRADLPEALERLILKAIARDPEHRYQNANEFIAALDALSAAASEPRQVGFTASVSESANGPLPTSADRTPVYLAVLPFEAVDSPADPERVCAALAGRLPETLSGALASTSGLRVVATPETRPDSDPREIATRAGANMLLRGAVRREGSDLRVAYSLLDPVRGLQVGGGVVDGSAFHTFEVEDRVVTSVVRTLGLGPGPAIARPAAAPDPVERERYLQALGYLRRSDNEASVDGAIAQLERLSAARPDVAAYHAALSRAFFHKAERTRQRFWESRAATACARAQELDPSAPETLVALGELQWRTGRHDLAIESFRQVLICRPDDYDAMLGTARAHVAAGRIDQATSACRELISLQPQDWRGHHILARVHYNVGDFASAVERWRRVAELTPDNAGSFRHLGAALYKLDRIDDAIEAFRRSIAIQPHHEAFFNLGVTLYFREEYDEALDAFRKSAELSPSEPLGWGNLGNALHWLPGRRAEAVPMLERAVGLMREQLERDPTRAPEWARLAGWLANLHRNEEARQAIERAIALAPHDVHCMMSAGQVYLQLGERETCLEWLRRAREAGLAPAELKRSRGLAALRADPDFQRIVEDVAGNGPC